MQNNINEQWLLDMRQDYQARAEDKVSELSCAIKRYLNNPDSERSRRSLHRLLHNLIGSGGSYGFPEVSSVARDMSDILKSSRLPEQSIDVSSLTARLEAELDRLRHAFKAG